MISYIINTVLFFGGVHFYVCGRKDRFLVVFYLIMTSFMGLLPAMVVKTGDLGMLLCFMVLLLQILKSFSVKGVNDDALGKTAIIMYVYIAARSFASILFNEDSLVDILLTIRPWLFWLTYFTFRNITLKDFEKSWDTIFVCVLISTALNLLQYLGLNFGNYHALAMGSRCGLPYNIIIAMFWICLTKKSYAIVCTPLLLVAFIMGSSRLLLVIGLMMFAFITLSTKKIKNINMKVIGIVFVVVGLCTMFFLFQSGLLNRFGRINEISNDVNGLSRITQTSAVKESYLESGSSATMLFRLVLAKERWTYMWNNPQYMLFGIGPIYDDPRNPYNRFNFYLGTARLGGGGIHQIDTVDISFVTPFFRYGIVGLIIYILMIVNVCRELYKGRKYSALINSAYLCALVYVLQSFGSAHFERFAPVSFILIAAGVSYSERKEMKGTACGSNAKKVSVKI